MVNIYLNLVKCDALLNMAKPWLSLAWRSGRPDFQVVNGLLILQYWGH